MRLGVRRIGGAAAGNKNREHAAMGSRKNPREVGIMTNEPLLLLSEAAELLHVSEDHLASLARAGNVPAAKPGRRWVFKRSALMAWIDAGCPAKEKETAKCHSTKSKALASGTSASRTMANELDTLLAQAIGGRSRSTTTNSRPTSGAPLRLVSEKR